VEAGRLRRALDRYYLTAGGDDPIIIAIPKGAYVPTFQVAAKADRVGKTDRRQKERQVTSARPSIAVMPLINLTGDPSQDYFVDGLTEEFTAELVRYQDFQVIASRSSMHFKHNQDDPQAIGMQLKVRFLLTGSVRKDQDSVKVTTQLVDTSSGIQIWSENHKSKLNPTSLIDIQENIAFSVIGAIADYYGLISRHLSLESRKKAPAYQRAYDAVLRFYRYENVLNTEAFKEALEALEQAVEIEPDYGLAWSMLGHLHADNYALGFCEIEAPLEKALTYARRGLSLAPNNQFASDALSLIYFHRGDKDAFIRHVNQTIALNPNAPYIVGVAGWHLALFGEWERGLALLKKGMQCNPYYPSWFHLATFLNAYRLGDYEQALAEAVRFNFPGLYLDPMMRAAALGQIGKAVEAAQALDELLKLIPDFALQGRRLMGRYVKVDGLIDHLIDGLRQAGLKAPNSQN
jgi:adenylate cyclase